jgi:thiol-disulfide isomerase/thioredoxin
LDQNVLVVLQIGSGFDIQFVFIMTASSAVQEIETLEQFQDFIKSAGPNQVVALNFWAPWAAPCKQMNQVFAELSLKYPSVKFAQVLPWTLLTRD